jgi:transposase
MLYMSRPFGSAAALEQRRRRAVEAVTQGERVKDVARIFGVRTCSVYRWLAMACQPHGLMAKPHPGPKPELTVQDQKHLENLLLQGARAHGWPNELWTCQRIAVLIERYFGVRWHHDHVGRFLHQRLRWSPQKPKRQARERNEAGIVYWKRYRFPHILRAARKRGAHVVFLDESGFQLTPCVRRSWGPEGITPILHSWDRRDRISAISCVTVSPRQRRLNLYFQLLPDNKTVKADHIVDYLRNLKAQLGGGFTVIWDGSKIHSKSGLVRNYLENHPEVVAETLPAYAPELNPDEGVWGWTKYGKLSNLAANDTSELRTKVTGGIYELKRSPTLLHSMIKETGLRIAA